MLNNDVVKKAFTLIELLVVIAIIAILAAILFPVFAQAKNASKKTASLSNLRQIGTAAAMYEADYDDMTPPVFWFNPADLRLPTTQGFYYYPILLGPYTKNYEIFLCPNDKAEDALITDSQGRGRFDKNNEYYHYLVGANPSYGYNFRYLNTLSLGGMMGSRPLSAYAGVSATSLNSPAETVMFAEATMKDQFAPAIGAGVAPGQVKGTIGYSRVEPPFSVPQVSPFAPSPGWINSYPDARSQGNIWGRFDSKRALVMWVDGHVKSTPINSLKGQGTTEQEVNRFFNGQGAQ